MIKMIFCVKRRPDIPANEFYDYWLNQHGPLVKSVSESLNIKRYVQSHTRNADFGDAVSAARGMKQTGFDGVAELWWQDFDALQDVLSAEAGQAASALLAEDEARFIDMEASTIFFTEEHEVISAG
jgi:uncharacterized protein (TIGR02118 family)